MILNCGELWFPYSAVKHWNMQKHIENIHRHYLWIYCCIFISQQSDYLINDGALGTFTFARLIFNLLINLKLNQLPSNTYSIDFFSFLFLFWLFESFSSFKRFFTLSLLFFLYSDYISISISDLYLFCILSKCSISVYSDFYISLRDSLSVPSLYIVKKYSKKKFKKRL